MARGGHNRKAKIIKMHHGTYRADRNPKNEPDPEVLTEIPKPPSFLHRYGKQFWKKLVPVLIEEGLLTVVDLPALEICCDLYAQWREAHDAVFRPVDPETGKKGKRSLAQYMKGRNSQTQPEYSAMKSSYQAFKSYMAEFGLSPLARNRIDIPMTKEDLDPMEELLDEEM
jgi:P27 family predicted phage terminase small subunit